MMDNAHRRRAFVGFGFGLVIVGGCGSAASAPHPALPPKLHTNSFFEPSLTNADQYIAFHVTAPSQTEGHQQQSIYVALPPQASLRPKNAQIMLMYQGTQGIFHLI